MSKHNSKHKSVEISRYVTPGVSALVLACFFLSGLTGIIYEILWTRMIVKVVGSAPFAVSIILTIFMGGLGLGSFLTSRMIDRVEEPQRLLRMYALLELAIGGYGIVLPSLLTTFKPIYSVVYNQLFNHFLFYNFFTLLGCSILLLIPVTCMGATLPILCRFYISQLDHLGTRAGRLYGLNTIGAAVGSLLCGFWLINLWNVWGTLSFAIFLNGCIGAHCLITSYQMKGQQLTHSHSAPGTKRRTTAKDIPNKSIVSLFSRDMIGALIVFAISGFCVMAYEVIWTKLLGLIIGPTSYSFTIVLTTFIIGLALGSVVFGWLADKTKKPLELLIFTQLGAAFLALGISQLLGNSQFFFSKLIYHFKDNFTLLALIKGGILFGLMIGPTLCLGATFPLVGKICTQSLEKVGKSIGLAYAINTLGAVLGSFCAGFLLIPFLGKEWSLSLVVGLQISSSLAMGGYILWRKKASILQWIPLGAVALLALMLCLRFPHWNRQLLSMGRYNRFADLTPDINRSGWLEGVWEGEKILEKHQLNSKLLYYGDGIGGFTTVVKTVDALGTPDYSLLNSGKPDASTRGDMPTQTLLAHLPLLFHPNPKEVMVLGLASGITAGEVLHYPIERLDIVEISNEAVFASTFFTPWNNKVLSHPKTQLIIQDGRVHLEHTNRRYDIIISEPSNPWMAGLASLFTKEFIILAKERLNKDGIFVQWVHSYQMDWSTFALIGRTFSQVFPHSLLVSTFPGGTSDYLMIGFKGENGLMLSHANKNIPYAQQSKNITLTDPRVLYRLIASEEPRRLFGSGPVHSDSRPHLEFAAPKLMYTDDPSIERNIWSKRWLSQETKNILRGIKNVEGQISFATFALSVYMPFYNMVDLSMATTEQREHFFRIVEDYFTRFLIKDYSIFTDQELKERCLATQIENIQNNIHLVPDKTVAYNHLGIAYFAMGEPQLAVECYQKILAINTNDLKAHYNLGNVYSKIGKLNEAIAEYKQVIAVNSNFPEAHNNLGLVYAKKGMLDEAISEFKKILVINPNAVEAYSNIGLAYYEKNMLDEAIIEYKKALVTKTILPKIHYNLGIAYYYKRNYKLAITHCNKAIEFGDTVNPRLLELIELLKPYR